MEQIVCIIIFIGTTENYFDVFVLPLLALKLSLKEEEILLLISAEAEMSYKSQTLHRNNADKQSEAIEIVLCKLPSHLKSKQNYTGYKEILNLSYCLAEAFPEVCLLMIVYLVINLKPCSLRGLSRNLIFFSENVIILHLVTCKLMKEATEGGGGECKTSSGKVLRKSWRINEEINNVIKNSFQMILL